MKGWPQKWKRKYLLGVIGVFTLKSPFCIVLTKMAGGEIILTLEVQSCFSFAEYEMGSFSFFSPKIFHKSVYWNTIKIMIFFLAKLHETTI